MKKKKPLKWYCFKLICQFGWKIRYINSWKIYYKYLNKMVKCGFNYYGEPVISQPRP
jgi:hypothetical protein